MRIARIALGFLFVVGCSSSATRATPDEAAPVGAASQAIQGGTADTADTFAVGIRIGNAGSCSGTLITPNLVVTARHCVDQSPASIDCSTAAFGGRLVNTSQFKVSTSANLYGNSAVLHSVSQIITPPGNTLCGADIALLILSDVVDSSEATPAIPGVQYPIDDSRYANHKFNAIGYGITSVSGNDAGTRRIRTSVRINCTSSSDIFQTCDDYIGGALPQGSSVSQFVTENDFIAGDATCEGDSGSGAYDTTTFASKPLTLGVLSRGSADGDTCILATYTRLDKWRDLVVQAADTASAGWTKYPKPTPDWTVYVAPPNKDGGTDSGPTSKGTATIGEGCTSSKDCVSGLCINSAAGTQVCSQACTASSECPDSYSCTDSYCQAGPSPTTTTPSTTTAAPTTTTTSGCSIHPLDPEPTPWYAGAGLAAVVGLAFARRRKSA